MSPQLRSGPPAPDEPTPPRVGVVILDPLHVVQTGLATLIGTQPDMRVLGRAGDATAGMNALRRVRTRASVIVLVGLRMEGPRDSFWLIRTMRERFRDFGVLACGHREDRMMISRALFSGADGYLDHSVSPPDFLDGIRRGARGDFVLEGVPTDWLGPIADGIERQREVDRSLTTRELQVLTVAAEGLTARQIATRLGVQERTVTSHLGNIYSKLGAAGRVEAVTTAARSGLLTLA